MQSETPQLLFESIPLMAMITTIAVPLWEAYITTSIPGISGQEAHTIIDTWRACKSAKPSVWGNVIASASIEIASAVLDPDDAKAAREDVGKKRVAAMASHDRRGRRRPRRDIEILPDAIDSREEAMVWLPDMVGCTIAKDTTFQYALASVVPHRCISLLVCLCLE